MPKSKAKQNTTTKKKAEREKNKECGAATLKALLVIGFGRSVGIPLPQTSDFIKGRNRGQRTGKKSHLHFTLSFRLGVCSSSPSLTLPHPSSPCGPASRRLDLRRGEREGPSRSEPERRDGGSGREAPALG